MKMLAHLPAGPVTWTHPHALRREFELRCGHELAATLRFRSAFGTFATGESADGTWTFKRVGFWQTCVTVRAGGSDADLGVFRSNTWSGGGSLLLPGSRKIFATANEWQSTFEFDTEGGEPLLRLKRRGVVHLAADVEILPAALSFHECPWLVMLAWYLAVMSVYESTSAAAVVASTAPVVASAAPVLVP